jgi:hypothetical protein
LDKLTDPAMRRAVETSERYADGLLSSEEHETAHRDIYRLAIDGSYLSEKAEKMGVPFEVYMSLVGLSLSCGFSKAGLDQIEGMNAWAAGARLTAQHQPFLIRDIFANAFRPVGIEPRWLLPKVVSIAQSIYEDRAFNCLPDLADALESAGCDDLAILDHCRSEGPHARGCWPVDLILGKS